MRVIEFFAVMATMSNLATTQAFSTSCNIRIPSRIQKNQFAIHDAISSTELKMTPEDEEHHTESSTRRTFLSAIASTAFIASAMPLPSFAASSQKVLVLGGTGFVGSEVVRQLRSLGIDVIATSRDGRDGTVAFDALTSKATSDDIEKLSAGCTAVISCVGAIGTEEDKRVNAASGLAAVGAKKAGVERFVYIGVAPEVKDSAGSLAFLEGYMSGKDSSVQFIQQNFQDSGYLIEPTFIYGGSKFGVNPPRVAAGYGRLVEGILSAGVFRGAAGVLPGLIGVALEPPVSVEDVAGAAVAGALGKSKQVLDTHDKIVEAAATLKV